MVGVLTLLPLFTARQLAWMFVLVFASGLLLLIPFFTHGDADEGFARRALRNAHSASTLLLVVGTLGHAVARVRGKRAAGSGVSTGILASSAIGLATISGGFLAAPDHWAARLGSDPEGLRHASSVFHFAYASMLSAGLLFWHARSLALPPRLTFAREPLVWTLLVALAGLLAAASDPRTPTPATRILLPTIGTLWVWSVCAPQLFWLVCAWRARTHNEAPRPP